MEPNLKPKKKQPPPPPPPPPPRIPEIPDNPLYESPPEISNALALQFVKECDIAIARCSIPMRILVENGNPWKNENGRISVKVKSCSPLRHGEYLHSQALCNPNPALFPNAAKQLFDDIENYLRTHPENDPTYENKQRDRYRERTLPPRNKTR